MNDQSSYDLPSFAGLIARLTFGVGESGTTNSNASAHVPDILRATRSALAARDNESLVEAAERVAATRDGAFYGLDDAVHARDDAHERQLAVARARLWSAYPAAGLARDQLLDLFRLLGEKNPPDPDDRDLRADTERRWRIARALRPEVLLFAAAMEERLRANDHKTGWRSDDYHALMDRLHEEAGELEGSILAKRAAGSKGAARIRVRKEAADVANFAMMLADNEGDLMGLDVNAELHGDNDEVLCAPADRWEPSTEEERALLMQDPLLAGMHQMGASPNDIIVELAKRDRTRAQQLMRKAETAPLSVSFPVPVVSRRASICAPHLRELWEAIDAYANSTARHADNVRIIEIEVRKLTDKAAADRESSLRSLLGAANEESAEDAALRLVAERLEVREWLEARPADGETKEETTVAAARRVVRQRDDEKRDRTTLVIAAQTIAERWKEVARMRGNMLSALGGPITEALVDDLVEAHERVESLALTASSGVTPVGRSWVENGFRVAARAVMASRKPTAARES